MRIIDIAICIDNEDPKGLGRIRCVRLSDYVGAKERALEYEPFDRDDPFIAIPFLPLTINLIPEKGQAVKIISYNTEKTVINQEYIAGPFSTAFDFNSQTFSNQLEDTTYGNINLESPKLIEPNGEYVNKKSVGSLAKKTDYGIYGRYGSDMIFTENGLVLRGGKLLPKTSKTDRKKLAKIPLMSEKSSVLHLKKYPKNFTLVTEEENITEQEIGDIKTILEYEIVDNQNNINLDNPTKINIYIYGILKKDPQLTKTNFFNEDTVLSNDFLKLFNENNDDSPTIVLDVNNVNDIKTQIKNVIYTMIEKDLNYLLRNNGNIKLDQNYNTYNQFPLFYRPTLKLKTYKTQNQNQSVFLNNIYNNLTFFNKFGPKSGLFWSKEKLSVPTISRKVKTKKIRETESEQTFSSLRSDKIFLLSTNTNETDKKIDFSILNKYEIDQEQYVTLIEPNTYSIVRGEVLLNLLNKILDVLYNHEHNLIGPMVKNEQFDDYVELERLRKTIENDLLNKSIKLN